jgi:hypothetical protein
MSNENVCRFEKLLQGVKREGVEELLNFIRGSDFYTAPASTRYHLAEEGGLLKHSLHVYDCLMKKKENPVWKEALSDVSDDTIILVSLLHDLCKTYFYGEELKNRKTYDEEKVKAANPRTVKRDANGEFIWETVPAYVVDDKYPLGHGEKSVFFIMQFVKLTMLEIAAIKHHMGAYCDSSQWNTLGQAYEKYPLALALHESDLEATYLLETE